MVGKADGELVIDVNNSSDVYYWSKVLKVSPGKLRMVVKTVGNKAIDAKEFIKNGYRITSNSRIGKRRLSVSEIFNLYTSAIYSVSRQVTGSTLEAETLLIKTFVKLSNPCIIICDKAELCNVLSKLFLEVSANYSSANKTLLKEQYTDSKLLHEILFKNMVAAEIESANYLPTEKVCKVIEMKIKLARHGELTSIMNK